MSAKLVYSKEPREIEDKNSEDLLGRNFSSPSHVPEYIEKYV